MKKFDSIFSNIDLPFGRFVILAANSTFLAIFASALILIGVLLDTIFGMMWLARFGAVMTIFALFQIWLSFKYMKYMDSVNPLQDKYIPAGSSSWTHEEWCRRIKMNNPSYDDEGVNVAAKTFLSIAGNLEGDMPKMATVTVGLVEGQLAIAALGTLIWAFGDIVASKLLHCGEWTC